MSLIAEFKEQSFTQIVFPHSKTDWIDYLDEAQKCFIDIINTITKYQKCLVVCYDISEVKKYFTKNENLYFVEYETDDTWARDISTLCVKNKKNDIELLDFTFNGWGGKFEALKDNNMSKKISNHYSKKITTIDFILEGGGVESNGKNIILTTSKCIFNKNRNKNLSKDTINQRLKTYFSVDTILSLDYGYLVGDDTDSHIDTLARFIDEDTILYVKSDDKDDEHYEELTKMELQLKEFAKQYSLKLIALPMCSAIYYKDERLPATYANFLFVNGAVLVPTYGIKEDKEALSIFERVFPQKDIIPIDSRVLIKQHGSLHCVTMNFASGVDCV